MDIVHPRCCGIDVHNASDCCCISIKESGKTEKLKGRYGTTTSQLREMKAWLKEHRVTTVAMEATGVYWKPVRNLLEGEFELLLVNPQAVSHRPTAVSTFRRGFNPLGDFPGFHIGIMVTPFGAMKTNGFPPQV
jgi:hypothetical protein